MGYDVTMNGDALAGKLAPWPASGTNIDGTYCSKSVLYQDIV